MVAIIVLHKSAHQLKHIYPVFAVRWFIFLLHMANSLLLPEFKGPELEMKELATALLRAF